MATDAGRRSLAGQERNFTPLQCWPLSGHSQLAISDRKWGRDLRYALGCADRPRMGVYRMGIVFGVLRLACVVLFTLSIPLMVRARFRNPEFPAWLLILLA